MQIEDFKLYGHWAPSETLLVGVVVRDQHGRFLMQLRDDFDHVLGGGRWALFGGHVDAGEALAEAATREIEEELGLKLDADALSPIARYVAQPRGDQMFVCEIKRTVEPHEIRLGEGAGFAFVTREQIMDLDIVPSVRDFARSYVLSPQP